MKTTHEKVKAKIVAHENGKPVVYLSIHRADLKNLLIETGKQPQDLFTVVVKSYGVEY